MPITVNPDSYTGLVYRFDSDVELESAGVDQGSGGSPFIPYFAWGGNGNGKNKDAEMPVLSSCPAYTGSFTAQGKRMITFSSGVNSHYRLPLTPSSVDLSGATGATIFGVVSVDNAAAERNIFAIASSGTSNNVLLTLRVNASNKLEVLYRPTPTASPVVVASSSAISTFTTMVVSARVNFATGAVNLYVNGTSVGSATGLATGSITNTASECPLYPAIGIARKATLVGNGFTGDIASVIVYKNELSTTDHGNVISGYLKPKYITG